MASAHLYLVAFWLAYYVFHSILAATNLKNSIRLKSPGFYPYYRACYSSFFLITLVAILYYQAKIESPLVFGRSWLNYLAGIPMGIVGVLIMVVCIRKYFYHLSGIKVFYQKKVEKEDGYLEVDGLHKWMRHPLYAGTLLFAWSLFLVHPACSTLIMCLMMHGYLLVGIRIEERKLSAEFGPSYTQYKKRTPMLIPNFRRTD